MKETLTSFSRFNSIDNLIRIHSSFDRITVDPIEIIRGKGEKRERE